jgi:uncharacterized membrane-anchored protein YitT (DUF2179 family)
MEMALIFLGLTGALKLQKSIGKYRRLGKNQYFCRVASNEAEVVKKIFRELDENAFNSS